MRFILVILINLLYASSLSFAQPDRDLIRENPATQTEKRIALVIGNGAYLSAPTLRNPTNDSKEMTEALRSMGFDVSTIENAGQRQMKQLIREFGQKLKGGGVGVFYYAGHGVQSKGRNYLIPVDADIQSETDVEDLSVDLNLVLGLMEEAGNGLNIVILDACRNNPFARSYRSAANGLAQMTAPTGTLIAYATAPGSVASDGNGKNGIYTSELLKQMKEPGVQIETVFKRVGTGVSATTSGRQEPWIALSLRGDFYFVPGNNAKPEPKKASGGETSRESASSTKPVDVTINNVPVTNIIVTRDVDALRVILKSALPMKLQNQYGGSLNGIRCSFEFLNLETQRPIVVAMNAIAASDSNRMGSFLRSALVDDNGGLWRVVNSDVVGISVVGVGQQHARGPFYNATDIVAVLSRREELNADVDSDKRYANGRQNRFVWGSSTEISPGKSLSVTITFVQDANQTTTAAPPKVFQMATEIVVGTQTSGTKKSYSLYNLTFDRVSLK